MSYLTSWRKPSTPVGTSASQGTSSAAGRLARRSAAGNRSGRSLESLSAARFVRTLGRGSRIDRPLRYSRHDAKFLRRAHRTFSPGRQVARAAGAAALARASGKSLPADFRRRRESLLFRAASGAGRALSEGIERCRSQPVLVSTRNPAASFLRFVRLLLRVPLFIAGSCPCLPNRKRFLPPR